MRVSGLMSMVEIWHSWTWVDIVRATANRASASLGDVSHTWPGLRGRAVTPYEQQPTRRHLVPRIRRPQAQTRFRIVLGRDFVSCSVSGPVFFFLVLFLLYAWPKGTEPAGHVASDPRLFGIADGLSMAVIFSRACCCFVGLIW